MIGQVNVVSREIYNYLIEKKPISDETQKLRT